MGDSQQYEVLPIEEIEDIKKQLALLSTRIEGTKRKLVLESKLRDAAQSLNRLHSANSRDSVLSASGNRHRRSAMGSRGSTSELLNKPEDDLIASTKKCEDLAQELWRQERRAQELQRRLLEHTAGVLQMTHKGYLTEHTPHPITPNNANGREMKHFLHEALDFDDHSFYQSLETMLDLGYGEGKADSQDRTKEFARQTQFILETERRLEDLNQRLRDSIILASKQSQQLPTPPARNIEDEGDPTNAVHEQLAYLEKGLEIIQENNAALHNAKKSAHATEERLEDLNNQLHGMISRSKEQGSPPYPLPPNVSGENSGAQIGYLEQGLDIVEQTIQRLTDASQGMSSRAATHEEKSGHFETILLGLWDILTADEAGTKKDGQTPDSPKSPSTYEHFSIQAISEKVQSLCARAKSLQEQKDILGRQIQQQRKLNSSSDAEKDAKFTDMTLELAQSKESMESLNREAKESRDKLAFMVGRLDELEQDAVLREHQRETKESSILQAEKDARILTEERLKAELRAKQDAFHAEKDARVAAEERLNAEFGAKHDAFQAEKDARIVTEERLKAELEAKHDAFQAERDARIEVEERLYSELQEKQDEIIKLQEELQDFKDDYGIANAESLAKLAQSEKQIKDLSSQIRSLNEDLEHHKACEAMLKESVERKTKEVETAHLEMENIESDMVRLQTEVTVARAELDGAYGTRAQRAAEVATNPAIQKELDDLAAKNASLLTELAALKSQQEYMSGANAEMAQRAQVLQRELSETIGEYEIMTKSSLEFEKEREQLENVIDQLRDRCESIESELSDERVRWLGMNSPSSSGGRDSHPPGTTSTMVLKNEFKKMMRETRAENLKALRVNLLLPPRTLQKLTIKRSLSKRNVANSRLLYVHLNEIRLRENHY